MESVCLVAAASGGLLVGDGSKTLLLLLFAVAAAIVVVTGTKLSRYGDALGERTGLGEGLVGLLFLAAVTSLPELVVSTTSTLHASLRALETPDPVRTASLYAAGADLAVGNMLGSNVFNLMIIAVMDVVQGRGAFLFRLHRNHIMSAASGLLMLGVVLFGFAVGARSDYVIPGLGVGIITPILLLCYIGLLVLQGRLEHRDKTHPTLEEEIEEEEEEERLVEAEQALIRMPAARFYGILLGLAALIVAGGMWLSLLGDEMAVAFNLGQSFVGTVFLAISTSLPELVVAVAAVRMGLFNMAVGNVLGSNIFNMVILFTADIALRGGSLLHHAGAEHLVTMAMVTMLTCVTIVGLMYRTKRHFATLGLDAWLMVVIYLFGNAVMYWLGLNSG